MKEGGNIYYFYRMVEHFLVILYGRYFQICSGVGGKEVKNGICKS